MKVKIGKAAVTLIQGDITEMRVDAIVNAANSSLAHGGGVAGAISRKGGPSIQDESDMVVKARGGAIPVGSVAVTSAGDLPCKYVIHAVGPRMGAGAEDEKLKNATLVSLETAKERGLKRIAFPAISTGIFGYPIDRCAVIMLSVTIDFLRNCESMEEVIFCLFGQESYDVFQETLQSLQSA